MDSLIAEMIKSHTHPHYYCILFDACRDILDLYRGSRYQFISRKENLKPPAPKLAMILHNDCMYLSHYCLTSFLVLPLKEYHEKQILITHLVGPFRTIALTLFNQQLVQDFYNARMFKNQFCWNGFWNL